jgi:Skp family chaperone for outer membrane proteins
MSHLKKILFALALLFGSAAFTAPAAVAQGSNVIAIDEVKILRDSKAGKDMATKLNNIETQMNGELTPERNTLQTQGKALDAKLSGKTREQVNADAALVSELNGYQAKANAFAAKAQRASQEFSLTERVALANFNKALEPVLLQVIQEKKCSNGRFQELCGLHCRLYRCDGSGDPETRRCNTDPDSYAPKNSGSAG